LRQRKHAPEQQRAVVPSAWLPVPPVVLVPNASASVPKNAGEFTVLDSSPVVCPTISAPKL